MGGGEKYLAGNVGNKNMGNMGYTQNISPLYLSLMRLKLMCTQHRLSHTPVKSELRCGRCKMTVSEATTLKHAEIINKDRYVNTPL